MKTLEFTGVPASANADKEQQSADNDGETEGTTTNKSGMDNEDGMNLECDGN